MLETLRIKNIAVIDSAEVQFKAGLNILSGETGAGKSVVIDAIGLLLGGRANSELIRAECEEASVEGLFDVGNIPWMLERMHKHGFESNDSEVLIKRIVNRAGRHRIYVNGQLATLAILQDLCDGLVDLCGQHEHQSLLRPTTQLDLVDRFGNLAEQAKMLSLAFSHYRSLKREYSALKEAENERSKKSDFLQFQLKELREADLRAGEEDELQNQKQLLQSAEQRLQNAESVRSWLDDDDGALTRLKTSVQKLRALKQLDAKISPVLEGLERSLIEAEEASIGLGRYLNGIEADPGRLEEIQNRLALLATLRRKYGASSAEMLQTLSQLEKEHQQIDQIGEQINEIEKKLHAAEAELKQIGTKLSKTRASAAKVLGASVTAELKDLKMEDAELHIELSTKTDLDQWNSSGADTTQFVVKTNRGEAARPLGKIASGGELSRLMLAIRRVIADRGGIGVYLFDEIDAGIGGQTAFKVGSKLKSVASYNQVICITHLPQIAAFADHHLNVKKEAKGKRTIAEIAELSHKERKEELARMLGGAELSKKSLENAAELLGAAAKQSGAEAHKGF